MLGQHTKRPDVVLYVNGIALVTHGAEALEGRGVGGHPADHRQPEAASSSARSSRPSSSSWLATTSRDCATPSSTRLRSTGSTGGWSQTSTRPLAPDRRSRRHRGPLDQALVQLCSKQRLLEIIHDFIVFDAGVKKTCRHNQYFGVKAAQARVDQARGRHHLAHPGLRQVADHGVAGQVDPRAPARRPRPAHHRPHRAGRADRGRLQRRQRGRSTAPSSGIDLLDTLNRVSRVADLLARSTSSAAPTTRQRPRRGRATSSSRELNAKIPKDFSAKGNLFVFVDEAHRTQSGKMHDAMKELLPGAMFIGFTGTPLLKADKTTSIETFGTLHPHLQVRRGRRRRRGARPALRGPQHRPAPDLARQGRQVVRGQDQGHDRPVQGRAQEALGHDAEGRQRRAAGRADRQRHPARHGDQAAPDGRPRQRHPGRLQHLPGVQVLRAVLPGRLQGQVRHRHQLRAAAPATSPRRTPARARPRSCASTRSTGRCWPTTSTSLPTRRCSKVEQFEKDVKERFVEEPGQMRLLIVVDKLLTGFDAPTATYLYIDKKMRDHGLFQAICRVNRLDGDDKDYGYIVDYRDLFNSLRERHHRLHRRRPRRLREEGHRGPADGPDREGARGSRRGAGADPRDLRAGRPAARARSSTSSTSAPPSQGNAEQLKANEPKRVELYKAVAAVVARLRQPGQRDGGRRLHRR